MPILKVTAQSAAVLDLEKLSPFQGAFKQLSEANYKRLRKQLLATGVSAAFTVWNKKGRFCILDGHQRAEALRRMKKEGINIPPLPVTWADCKDDAEARRVVLSLASTYGDVDKSFLKGFAKDAGLNLDKLDGLYRFPDIVLTDFESGMTREPETPSKHKTSSALTHKCPKCGHRFGKGAK